METLASNLKRLRRLRRMTQSELAERAGLPRATLASMEQPSTNPGIEGAVAVARALGVTVDQLISPPPEDRFTKVPATEISEYRTDDDRFIARRVSPLAETGVDINHVIMLPGCDVRGRPHSHGADEFFYALKGKSQLAIEGELVDVEAGALVQFPGHYTHRYINPSSRRRVEALSVVVSRAPAPRPEPDAR